MSIKKEKYWKVIVSNKTLVKNFSSLSVLQVLNLILPFLSYTYLIRVLGSENYGLVIYAQAVVAYLAVFVNFGFKIFATKEVSVNRYDKGKLSEIVSSVIFLQLVIFVAVSFFVVLFALLFKDRMSNSYIYIFSLWVCLNEISLPVWYFQGIEKMFYITCSVFISKVLSVFLVFTFVNDSGDLLLVPVSYTVGVVLSGLISFYLIVCKDNLKLCLPNLLSVRKVANGTFTIFVSNLSVSLYSGVNKVVVGSFLGMVEVAHYDLAERVVNVFKMPIVVLGESIFPKVVRERCALFLKKIIIYSLIFNFGGFLILFVFSNQIVHFLGGDGMLSSSIVLKILSFTLPLISVSNILGVQMLIGMGFSRLFMRCIVLSMVVYFSILFILYMIGIISVITIALTVCVVECFVVVVMLFEVYKKRLWKIDMIF